MNLLLVNWMDLANPQAGGAEVHLCELFRRFVYRGDRVTLVASGFPGGGDEDRWEGIRIIRTGRRETFNLTAPGVIRRLCQNQRFDMVVEDINKVPVFTPLWTDSPVLAVVPHLFGTTVFREANAFAASYVWLMERPIPRVYRKAHFMAISASTASDLSARGIPRDRIEVIECGMDHDLYAPDPAVTRFDEPTILFVGRVKRYKSVDVIIRAMPMILERVPTARLVVVGSGDMLGNLRSLADSLGIGGRVHFTGQVSAAEKVDWMRRSHVIVNPSPKEGWGLTNIEANACGTVAVASDADGLRDSVRDGETGLLFPYGDSMALADRVVGLLGNDAERQRLERHALAWAAGFTWDDAAHKTMDMVDRMVKEHKKIRAC